MSKLLRLARQLVDAAGVYVPGDSCGPQYSEPLDGGYHNSTTVLKLAGGTWHKVTGSGEGKTEEEAFEAAEWDALTRAFPYLLAGLIEEDGSPSQKRQYGDEFRAILETTAERSPQRGANPLVKAIERAGGLEPIESKYGPESDKAMDELVALGQELEAEISTEDREMEALAAISDSGAVGEAADTPPWEPAPALPEFKEAAPQEERKLNPVIAMGGGGEPKKPEVEDFDPFKRLTARKKEAAAEPAAPVYPEPAPAPEPAAPGYDPEPDLKRAMSFLRGKIGGSAELRGGLVQEFVKAEFNLDNPRDVNEVQMARLVRWAKTYQPPKNQPDDFDKPPKVERATLQATVAREPKLTRGAKSLAAKINDIYLEECTGPFEDKAGDLYEKHLSDAGVKDVKDLSESQQYALLHELEALLGKPVTGRSAQDLN